MLASGRAYLYRVLIPMFTLAVMYPLNNALRGAGSAIAPMISNIVALWAVRVPLAYVFAYAFGKENLYWAYPIGWAIGIAISGTVYFRGRWKEKCLGRAGLAE